MQGKGVGGFLRDEGIPEADAGSKVESPWGRDLSRLLRTSSITPQEEGNLSVRNADVCQNKGGRCEKDGPADTRPDLKCNGLCFLCKIL